MASSALLVVLPTLGDRLEFLEATLRSCKELADQVPTTVAMVVPAHAESARSLGRRYGSVLIDDPGTGMADAVNAGLSARSTEGFYVWVGDDDELVPAGVVALMKALEEQVSAVVAYGHCEYIDVAGRVIGHSKAGALATLVLPWGPNLIPHPGTVVGLDALEAVGGFDSRLSYALDLDVFLKLRRVGGFISQPTETPPIRTHPDTATDPDRRPSPNQPIAENYRHERSWLRGLSRKRI